MERIALARVRTRFAARHTGVQIVLAAAERAPATAIANVAAACDRQERAAALL